MQIVTEMFYSIHDSQRLSFIWCISGLTGASCSAKVFNHMGFRVYAVQKDGTIPDKAGQL